MVRADVVQVLNDGVEQCSHHTTDYSHQYVPEHVSRRVQVAKVTCRLFKLRQCSVSPNCIDPDCPLTPIRREARKECVLQVVCCEKASRLFDYKKRASDRRTKAVHMPHAAPVARKSRRSLFDAW